MGEMQKLKQKIWRMLYPIFPVVEHRLLFLHLKKRQKYHIGWLAPYHTLEALKKHLSTKWGFGNHFVAWEDSSQVLSWRKLITFKEQYHIRIYNDGEIRGHFEYTPEAAPIRHFLERGERAKTKDFLNFLGPFVTIQKYKSHLKPVPAVAITEAEITFDKK